jgi:hypothetical protein
MPSRRHVCTSKAGPATARTRVLRIHQVNRTKKKLDGSASNSVVSFGWRGGMFSLAPGGVHFKQVLQRDGGIGA